MSDVGTFTDIFRRYGILNGKGVAKVGHQIYPQNKEEKSVPKKEGNTGGSNESTKEIREAI